MKLSEVRRHLQLSLQETDPELFDDMWRSVRHMADGRFLEATTQILRQYETGEAIRPTLPNKMQFLYMRDRQTFTFALFPELLPIAYQAGRAIGKAFDAPRHKGITLREALQSAIHVAEEFDYGRQELVSATDDFAVYRTYECADCYGLPDLGLKICAYEAGVAAGALESLLDRPVRVVEVKCCANGDPYDEFEVYLG